MARTERFKPAQVVKAIKETKGLVSLTAQRLRCDPETVRNYAKRHDTVALALKEEREAMLDIGELSLFNAVKAGEAWAVCFWLKTQGKKRGYIESPLAVVPVSPEADHVEMGLALGPKYITEVIEAFVAEVEEGRFTLIRRRRTTAR